jgi:hypothetical protein
VVIPVRPGWLRNGPNQDARGLLTAETQPTATDLQQARAAWLQHLQLTPVAQTKFGQPADPARLALYVLNDGGLAGAE